MEANNKKTYDSETNSQMVGKKEVDCSCKRGEVTVILEMFPLLNTKSILVNLVFVRAGEIHLFPSDEGDLQVPQVKQKKVSSMPIWQNKKLFDFVCHLVSDHHSVDTPPFLPLHVLESWKRRISSLISYN